MAGGVLAEEINDALENSQYLIVICSPRASHSEWVGKEVKAFIDMGRSDKIIPFIIGGIAHAQNPEEECFPITLREMPAEQDLIGVNINEMGHDAAAVKVVAQMFVLKFDELWQRYEKKQKRKKRLAIFSIVVFAIVALGIAGWIWHQNVKLEEKDCKMMENQARFITKVANDWVDEGDSYTAQRLLIEVMPENVNNPVDKPYTIETEIAHRKASGYNTTIFVDILLVSFLPP